MYKGKKQREYVTVNMKRANDDTNDDVYTQSTEDEDETTHLADREQKVQRKAKMFRRDGFVIKRKEELRNQDFDLDTLFDKGNDRLKSEYKLFPPELAKIIVDANIMAGDVGTKLRYFDTSPLYLFYNAMKKDPLIYSQQKFNALVKCLNSPDIVQKWLTNRIERRVPHMPYDSFHTIMKCVILGGFKERVAVHDKDKAVVSWQDIPHPNNVVAQNTKGLLLGLLNCQNTSTQITPFFEDKPDKSTWPEVGENIFVNLDTIRFRFFHWKTLRYPNYPHYYARLELKFTANSVTLEVILHGITFRVEGTGEKKTELNSCIVFKDQAEAGGTIATRVKELGSKYTKQLVVSERDEYDSDEGYVLDDDPAVNFHDETYYRDMYKDVITTLFGDIGASVNVEYQPPNVVYFCDILATFFCYVNLPFLTEEKYNVKEKGFVYFASFVDRTLH